MSTAVVVTDMVTKQWIGRTNTDLPGGTRVHVGKWIDDGPLLFDGKSFHKWDSGVITRDKKVMRELEHMEEVEVREY